MAERRFQRIAVLKGGRSAEREVSLVSGAECDKALRQGGFDVIAIDAGDDLPERLRETAPDAVFNALHGRWGEDGCVQGILEWMRIPYTHSGVGASALAMDKVRAKAAYAAAGLPIVPHLIAPTEEIAARHVMAPPYVAKPINEGSSVGVHIVPEGANSPPQVMKPDAPEQMMVERYVPGRELTVSVMGDRPLAVTEIRSAGWYDYHAKYSEGGSVHTVPAEVPAQVTELALAVALEAHRILGCRGVSRSDFRFDDQSAGPVPEALTILETNTQPGMTPTSLVPEQAQHCGIDFVELVTWMVDDASLDR